MKKIISVMLSVLLTFTLSVCALGKEVTVEEFKLTMEFPEDWYIVTQDSKEDEEVFELYLNYEPFMEYLEETGSSVYAFSDFAMNEMFVYLEQTEDYVPIKDLTKFALENTKKEAEKTWSDSGFDDVSVDTYEGTIETFVTVSYNYPYDNSTLFCIDYVGYVDGIYCEFDFTSYDGPISKTDIEDINSIVDSIVSENVVPESSGSSSSSFPVRFITRNIKPIGAAIVGFFAAAFAWFKKKFGKNKNIPEEADANINTDYEQPSMIENTEENTVTESGEYHVFTQDEVFDDIPLQEENRCPECGGMVSEDEKFCPLCGKKIK
ncbi:MAG: zinc ribbon domain-containing protein [Oscillospiraceae bacterium]|nr:zinc ribbon domain-containing protein [Oscillospiraceae bacterium]